MLLYEFLHKNIFTVPLLMLLVQISGREVQIDDNK